MNGPTVTPLTVAATEPIFLVWCQQGIELLRWYCSRSTSTTSHASATIYQMLLHRRLFLTTECVTLLSEPRVDGVLNAGVTIKVIPKP
jgi:hypothetical protein